MHFCICRVYYLSFKEMVLTCHEIRRPNTWGMNLAKLHVIYRSFSLSEHTLVIK